MTASYPDHHHDAMNTILPLVALTLLMFLQGCANSDYFEPAPVTDTGKAMVYVYRPAATTPARRSPDAGATAIGL